MKTKKFIEKARKIHGDKYDYSKVVYNGVKEKVIIICPIHGEFLQTPNNHINNKNGCSKCIRQQEIIDLQSAFIEKSKIIHNDKYDYSKVVYKKNSTKVIIICPIHGEFLQTPNGHLGGFGCAKCAGVGKSSTEEFIKKSKLVHGDKYDYSDVNYTTGDKKIKIICPIHGKFLQTPYSHLRGSGCYDCGMINMGNKRRTTTEEFIEDANKKHNDKYDYSLVKYKTAKTKVKIICPIHGKFLQTPDNHLQGNGCPHCSCSGPSKPETDMFNYIKSIYPGTVIQSDRSTISPLELDIYIPELKIAFEYNGLYWHSEEFKEKNYHVEKTNLCEENGIQLVHIWEDDWIFNQEITKNMIKAKMHLCKPKSYARKCSIIEPTVDQQKQFLNKHHIQGYGSGSIVYGLQHNLRLVALMVFKNSKDAYILNRFASDGIVGAFGKLLKHFRKQYNDRPVVSFGSRDVVFRNKNIYTTHNFTEVEIQAPDYSYLEDDRRNHKFGYRKNILVKKYPEQLNIDMTESEMTKVMGFPRIYGCGLIKYELV